LNSKSKAKKLAGYIIFGLSCILWLFILVIPWFDFTKAQIAGITTGLVIAGEVTFYLSIFILGKSFYQKIKNKLGFGRKKTAETDTQNPEQSG